MPPSAFPPALFATALPPRLERRAAPARSMRRMSQIHQLPATPPPCLRCTLISGFRQTLPLSVLPRRHDMRSSRPFQAPCAIGVRQSLATLVVLAALALA